MRIAIVGAGGVGGYFGGLLAQTGEDVAFIARGEHLRAIQREGLRVESINGSFHLSSVQATDNPTEVGTVDLVIVTTKTYDLDAAADAMQPLVGEQTTILPLQNGVEASERLAERFGACSRSGWDVSRHQPDCSPGRHRAEKRDAPDRARRAERAGIRAGATHRRRARTRGCAGDSR